MARSIIRLNILIILFTSLPAAIAQIDTVFVARPNQVVKLADLNGDGDFLDFAEQSVYADALPADLNRLAVQNHRLFIVAIMTTEIFVLEDLNGDGDALDFGEVRLFGKLPQSIPVLVPAGLATDNTGMVLTADITFGQLFAFRDLNGDGDALDFAERSVVAEGLNAPTAIASQADGVILINQTDMIIPVRILQDRNGDGDFLDFAENISYAENIAPGDDITAASNSLAFMLRSAGGEILALLDQNGDGDVLDFAEVLSFAVGIIAASVLTPDNAGGLYVSAQDATGTVHHIVDLNDDGDALDFGEVIPVAQGLMQPTGIAFVAAPTTGCTQGDINNDASVDSQDIPPMIEILICDIIPANPCPADLNNDGQLNALDIQGFVDLLICQCGRGVVP